MCIVLFLLLTTITLICFLNVNGFYIGNNDENITRISVISESNIKSGDNHRFWNKKHFKTSLYLENLSKTINNDTILNKCRDIMMINSSKLGGLRPENEVWSQAYQEWIIYHNFFYG